MADKELILKEKVEHTGLFDFVGFYQFANAWFREEDYGVSEERYTEKVKGNAKDMRIEWNATKEFSDYFKIQQSINFNIKDMSEVEVEINGTKKTMNKGNIEIEIKGFLIKDYESKWETSPGYRFLRDVYNKYIIPARVKSMKDRVEDEVQEFKDEMKAFLDVPGLRAKPEKFARRDLKESRG